MRGCPPISDEVLNYLSKVYPDKCPKPEMSEREIWMAVGAADVVRRLKNAEEGRRRTDLMRYV